MHLRAISYGVTARNVFSTMASVRHIEFILKLWFLVIYVSLLPHLATVYTHYFTSLYNISDNILCQVVAKSDVFQYGDRPPC